MKIRATKIYYVAGLLILVFGLLTARAYFSAQTSDVDYLVKELDSNNKYRRHSHFGIFTQNSYLPHWTVYYLEMNSGSVSGIYHGIFGDFGAFAKFGSKRTVTGAQPAATDNDPQLPVFE